MSEYRDTNTKQSRVGTPTNTAERSAEKWRSAVPAAAAAAAVAVTEKWKGNRNLRSLSVFVQNFARKHQSKKLGDVTVV